MAGSTAAQILISAIIVLILSLQAIVGFVNTGVQAWPLVAYPMYKTARFEGDRLDYDFSVYAVLADGSKEPITRQDLNMNFWLFSQHIVIPIVKNRKDALTPLIATVCHRHDRRVVKLVVEDMGVAIGKDGPVEGLLPETLGEVPVVCGS